MISTNDFRAEPPELRDAMLSAVKRVLDSGWYVLGNEVLTFESRWAAACDLKHGIGVGNGMDAHHPELGMNSRLDELQAAILLEKLKWTLQFTDRRRQIANSYRLGLRNVNLYLLSAPQETAAHVHHLFVVTSPRRDELQQHLLERDVQTHVHCPIPVHKKIPCQAPVRDPRGLAYTERHAATCLSLPCHPQMTDDDVASRNRGSKRVPIT